MDQSKSTSTRSCSEETTTLSAEAAFYFSSKQYDKCRLATKQLLDVKPNDPKVIMNKALLDFVHKHGYSHTDEYVAELKRIASIENIPLTFSTNQTSTEEIGPAAGGVTDSSDPSSSGANAAALTTCSSQPSLSQSVLGIVLQYNYALVLFYQRQYCQAERLLANCLGISRETGLLSPDSPCFQTASGIELTPSTDLTLSRRVVLLWLEVLLRLQHPEDVYNLCGTWLTYLSSLTIANTLNVSGQTAPAAAGSSSSTTHGSRHLNTQTSHMLYGIRLPLQLFYIRACLLTGRIAEANDELQVVRSERTQPVSDANSATAISHLPDDQAVKDTEALDGETEDPGADNDADAAAKAQSSALSPMETMLSGAGSENWDVGQSLEFLEAQLAYLKDDFTEAHRHLSNILPPSHAPLETGQCESVLVWNNIALVHHRAGQYNLSGLQFRRALRETDKLIRDVVPQSRTMGNKNTQKSTGYLPSTEPDLMDQIPLHAFSLSPHHVLLHNFGLQLLFARKPTVAFATLLQLVHTYPRNPRLWYRLAECCIKVHRPNNLNSWDLEARKRLVVEPVGSGPCRHLMLGVKQSEVSKPWIEAPSMSTPTLEFASLCLRNALILLPRPPSNLINVDHSPTQRRDALLRWSESQRVPALPAPSVISGVGLLHLLSAVYVATAYVALCLNNPVEVLASAGHLLAAPRTRRQSDLPLSGESQSSDDTRSVAHGSAGTGQADSTTLPSTSVSAKLPLGVGQNPLHLIVPPAYRYLARLYFAEALIMMDRLPESLSILSCGCSRPLSDVDCVTELSTLIRPVSLAPHYLVPDLRAESSNVADAQTKMSPDRDHITDGSIYPIDFPASSTQAVSLHLFNLACTLAISREWTVAQYYLLPSLTGLALSAAQLDGRKWPTSATVPPGTAPPPGIALVSMPFVLPFPALLLQLYLHLVLGKRAEALSLLRDAFGNECLSGRLNSTNVLTNALIQSPTETNVRNNQTTASLTKDPGWTIGDLRQLVKSNLSARSVPNSLFNHLVNGPLSATNTGTGTQSNLTGPLQRPTSLWLPPMSSAGGGSPSLPPSGRPIQAGGTGYTGSHLSTPNQPHFSMVNGRRDGRVSSAQPHTTGLITPANESDWPPL